MRGIGLVEDVFQFGRFVAGIDRDQDGADLGRGKLQDDPFRDVVGPDGDVVPLLDPQLQQPLGNLAADLVELAIGVAQAPLVVHQRLVVGIAPSHIVQKRSDRVGNLL